MFPQATFPLRASQLHSAIAQRSDSSVVEMEGVLAGFANLYRWENNGRCSIGNLVVAPALRGKGVAQFMLKNMIELAFLKYEASEVTISCFNANIAGLLCYPKLGFRPFEIEKRIDKHGNPVALIHLRISRGSL